MYPVFEFLSDPFGNLLSPRVESVLLLQQKVVLWVGPLPLGKVILVLPHFFEVGQVVVKGYLWYLPLLLELLLLFYLCFWVLQQVLRPVVDWHGVFI